MTPRFLTLSLIAMAVVIGGAFVLFLRPGADTERKGTGANVSSGAYQLTGIVTLNATQAATLKLEQAQQSRFVPTVSAVGTLDFNQNMTVQVFAPYQGRILKTHFNPGDRVEKDQVLFTIDSPDLLNAETSLITAAGVLTLQNATLKRVEKMRAFGGASQQSLDQSTSDQMGAEGALKAAREAVRIFGKTDGEIDAIVAERRTDSSLVVTSPMSGIVTARNAAPGLFVQAGASPAPYTVSDMSTLWMFAKVAESDSVLLAAGQTVTAQIPALPGQVFSGIVSVVGPGVDAATRRLIVRADLLDPDHRLRPGMLATFQVAVGPERQSLTVPEAAIVREGDGSLSLWVQKQGGRFERRSVKLGLFQGGRYEVQAGLEGDEIIVVEGAVFLSNKLAIDENSGE